MIGKFFRPMLPMDITNPEQTVFKHLKEEVAIEPKIDGIRCQLHKLNGDIVLYTRKGEDITSKFPEIVKNIQSWPENVVLDGELVCFDKNKILDFYDINRKLKSGIGSAAFLTFDILYSDGVVYDMPFWRRRELLLSLPITDHTRPVPQVITQSSAELKQIYISLIKKGFEGIMIKEPDASYFFNRTWNMKRLKPVRTIDLKVVGMQKGKQDYLIYDLASKEGLVTKIVTKKEFKIGEIVEVKYGKIIDSREYSLGKTLRFPIPIRKRNDKDGPDSLVRLLGVKR